MKKLMIAMIAVMAVLATLTAISEVGAVSIPLPYDIEIIHPGNDVPPEIANFSGKWHGIWDNNFYQSFESILVVEQLDQNTMKAEIIYAWGDHVWATGSSRGGYARITADLEERDGKFFISFSRASGKFFCFSLKNEGQELEGKVKTPGVGGYWWVTMKPD